MTGRGNRLSENRKKGALGELLTLNYLTQRGFEIVDKNIQVGHLEIDLLLYKENAYYFVEVKYRKSRLYGDPIEAMTKRKCQMFKRAVFTYLSQNQTFNDNIHLSFMGILEENGAIVYNWIEDFFA